MTATVVDSHARARFDRDLRNLKQMLRGRVAVAGGALVFVGRNAESSTRAAEAKYRSLKRDLHALDDHGDASERDWEQFANVERVYWGLA